MLGVSGRVIAGAAGKRFFDPDALTHIARLSSPSNALKNALNTLVVALKADGIWDNIYAICVQHNAQADSLFDLKGTQDSTNLAGATWSASGWSLGNDTGLIDTQVVPTASSSMIVPNDNHLMAYYATTITDTICYLMGGSSGTSDHIAISNGIQPLGSLCYLGDQWHSTDNARLVITTPGGCILGSLLSGTSRIRAGATQTSSTETINNTTNGTTSIRVGDSAGSFVGIVTPSETVTAWSAGSGLTATQFNDYYTHIQAYMVTMGWEV